MSIEDDIALLRAACDPNIGAIASNVLRSAVERILRERQAMLDNLTATQTRCTALLEETRSLKRLLDDAQNPREDFEKIVCFPPGGE